MTTTRLPREDLAAALAARRELGPDYDDAFIETVVERIEESLGTRGASSPAPAPRSLRRALPGGDGDHSLLMALVSLVAAIPLSAIAVVHVGLPGLVFVCVTIVLLNAIYTHRPRR
ncbi:hypothetical protein [Actinomadura roseirufa]|uniref:hypothetical protein n=1 Tax=Actinomadura roseirufa TaxID=2094049 RepID=UPI001040E110|nr:hypothetical protein [Actinomadura roseirufa]